MPELPEVETVARQLKAQICGLGVRRLQVLDPLLGRPATGRLDRRHVEDVFRLGKQVVLTLTEERVEPLHLVVHLRMTGRLVWFSRPRLRQRRHLRARLWMEGGSVLFYDPRRFGTLRAERSLEPVQPTGLDPVTAGLTPATLGRLLGESRQEIKVWLLRQDRLVGIGNIYASEVLFRAGVDPRRAAGSLDRAEQRRLASAVRRILHDAIDNCGTTFSDFQTARGTIGSYQRFLQVFKREGEGCPRCGEVIERVVQQGRSTFFCRRCQV